jgi:diadenosine tetraphosphate (Ap4A) HIT family hydrolase
MACNCEICAELAGLPSRFSSLYFGKLNDRIVGGSKNFIVMPSIGQLGDAHLMIVSRTHETAFARLGRDLRKELLSLLADIRTWLKTKVGGYDIAFENGDPSGTGHMNCSISHLHVHVVASRQLMPNLSASLDRLGAEPVASLDAVNNLRESYSFIDFGQDDSRLIRNRLPSQTIRKIIAYEIGMSKWDWREAENEDQLVGLALAARSELAMRNGSLNFFIE